MIQGLCKDCSYDDCVFTFCDACRGKNKPKKLNKQYDELYNDCKTDTQIFAAVVSLGNSGMTPPNLNELGYDVEVCFNGRSDIPVPEFFSENIKQLKKFTLKSREVKHMLSALHKPQHALASWEFNETFDTPYGDLFDKPVRPKFKEEYDMEIVEKIMRLIPKIKKVTRIE